MPEPTTQNDDLTVPKDPTDTSMDWARVPPELQEMILLAALKHTIFDTEDPVQAMADILQALLCTSQMIRSEPRRPMQQKSTFLRKSLEEQRTKIALLEVKLVSCGVPLYIERDDDGSDDEDAGPLCSCDETDESKEACYLHSLTKHAWEIALDRNYELERIKAIVDAALRKTEIREQLRAIKAAFADPQDEDGYKVTGI